MRPAEEQQNTKTMMPRLATPSPVSLRYFDQLFMFVAHGRQFEQGRLIFIDLGPQRRLVI
jgi:hypothetical protein